MTVLSILLKQATNARIALFKHSATQGKTDFYHNWINQQLDTIICVSKLVYNLQDTALNETQKHKLHLVYNGIWPKRLQKIQNIICLPPHYKIHFYWLCRAFNRQ